MFNDSLRRSLRKRNAFSLLFHYVHEKFSCNGIRIWRKLISEKIAYSRDWILLLIFILSYISIHVNDSCETKNYISYGVSTYAKSYFVAILHFLIPSKFHWNIICIKEKLNFLCNRKTLNCNFHCTLSPGNDKVNKLLYDDIFDNL